MFDDLLLLADGKTMYSGPIEEMVPYLAKLNFPCPQYTNPADFVFMSVIYRAPMLDMSGDEKQQQSVPLVTEEYNPKLDLPGLLAAWENDPRHTELVERAANPRRGGVPADNSDFFSNFCTQFMLLLRRAWNNQLRNRMMVLGKLMQTLIMSVIVGVIFLQLDNDQKSVQDRQGALFFCTVNNVMSWAMGVLSIFAGEKAVFRREESTGMYTLPAYFFSKIFVEFPFQILLPFIGSVILYFIIGFQATAEKFFLFAVTQVFLAACGSSIGVFCACFFENLSVALAVVPVLLLPLMLFSGFLINSASIPRYFIWLQYISPMKYGFTALSKNEFDGLTLRCNPDQLVKANGAVLCPITTGQQVISLLSLDSEGSIGLNILLLFIIYTTLMTMAYLALYRVTRKK
eukprot:TRINITY_DN6411_c0_g1_i2.p1 TRINITY_DN6411_c0_g1~~TRINITY_DN6411_c0_g1_i2.p1  ORF type:complete len:402 (-),score=109.31 TRINITY_DN6411_c0_g1_i2:48-1253(-)